MVVPYLHKLCNPMLFAVESELKVRQVSHIVELTLLGTVENWRPTYIWLWKCRLCGSYTVDETQSVLRNWHTCNFQFNTWIILSSSSLQTHQKSLSYQDPLLVSAWFWRWILMCHTRAMIVHGCSHILVLYIFFYSIPRVLTFSSRTCISLCCNQSIEICCIINYLL